MKRVIKLENGLSAKLFRESINYNFELFEYFVARSKITNQEIEDKFKKLDISTLTTQIDVDQNNKKIKKLEEEVDEDFYYMQKTNRDLQTQIFEMKKEIEILKNYHIKPVKKPGIIKKSWHWLTYSEGLETPKQKD